MPSRDAAYETFQADADFPGGNGVEFDRIRPDWMRFKMVKHASPFCLWWCIRARVPAGRRVTFELVNTPDSLGRPPVWRGVRPFFSYDQVRWTRLAKRDCVFDEASQTFRFSGAFAKPVVYLAQAVPYHMAELNRLRSDLRDSPLFRERLVGKTEEDRPYPLWLLEDTPPRGKKPLGVFLCGRHHAGETHGSWALEGMLREIAFGKSREAAWLRANVSFLVSPFVDLDGVWHAMYGKDRTPIDFNRDWSADPLRGEVRILQHEIDAWAQRLLYAAHFDFHCPGLTNTHHLHSSVPGLATERLKDAEKDFAKELARLASRHSPFAESDLVFPGYQGPTGEVTCSSYQRHVYGVLSLTPEVSYHPLRGGGLIEQPALLPYGAAHARALGRVLQRREAEVREHARPFYDAGESPPVAPAVNDPASAYRWWSNLGGKPERYSTRPMRGATPDESGEALMIEGDPHQSAFVLTPVVGPGISIEDLTFRARGEGVGQRRKGAAPLGLLIHVFFYDRLGRRFGRLNGSAEYDLPLQGTKGWLRFRAMVKPPLGAVYARLGIRSELARGRVLLAP